MREHLSAAEVKKLYFEQGLSVRAIGDRHGVSRHVIARLMKKGGIKSKQQADRPYKDRAWLYQKYIIESKSSLDIAAMFGITPGAICLWLNKLGIKTRSSGRATCLLGARTKIARHQWRGGLRRDSQGYVLEMRKGHPRGDKNGYVGQHILVMEEKLGRPVKIGEIVHHINGTTDDNRPENLALFPTNKAHLDHHRILRRKAKGGKP